jgi:transcriptional regulator of acetoin/glycerol metabolism
MCQGSEIQIQHLPPEFSHIRFNSSTHYGESIFFQDAEKQTILKLLQKNDWNKVETAKELGIHRGTLWRKMKKSGLI